MSEEEGSSVEFTPTWVVGGVCAAIVLISLAAERIINRIGKYLMKRWQIPLYEALQKIKAELMLLGFISLLLTVTQNRIGEWCIPPHLAQTWLPCDIQHQQESSTSSHFCHLKGKVALLSVTAVHHLHIFIFVLAVVHLTICALTVLFGGLKIRQWKLWEDVIQKRDHDPETGCFIFEINLTVKFKKGNREGTKNPVIHVQVVQQHSFVKNRFLGIEFALFGWIHAFMKQFYGSVTETDYVIMRMGFISTHCKGNEKFNFHKYMERSYEADFKKVVGISWFLWLLLVVYLLLNVAGFHAYFWLSFVPFALLLAVGTKLEHVITQLAEEVATRHSVVLGDILVKPSDHHFWFHRPRIVLLLIHIILFQNSFEVAIFFWVWVQYGFDSCIMGGTIYTIPRIIIAVIVQFICSYSTLPLYAIVTQMGSSFNAAIFEDYVQEGLVDWAHQAKKNVKSTHAASTHHARSHHHTSKLALTHEEGEIRPQKELRRLTTF